MSRLQVDVDDNVFDAFKRKHYREMGSAIERLMRNDLEEEEEEGGSIVYL